MPSLLDKWLGAMRRHNALPRARCHSLHRPARRGLSGHWVTEGDGSTQRTHDTPSRHFLPATSTHTTYTGVLPPVQMVQGGTEHCRPAALLPSTHCQSDVTRKAPTQAGSPGEIRSRTAIKYPFTASPVAFCNRNTQWWKSILNAAPSGRWCMGRGKGGRGDNSPECHSGVTPGGHPVQRLHT